MSKCQRWTSFNALSRYYVKERTTLYTVRGRRQYSTFNFFLKIGLCSCNGKKTRKSKDGSSGIAWRICFFTFTTSGGKERRNKEENTSKETDLSFFSHQYQPALFFQFVIYGREVRFFLLTGAILTTVPPRHEINSSYFIFAAGADEDRYQIRFTIIRPALLPLIMAMRVIGGWLSNKR